MAVTLKSSRSLTLPFGFLLSSPEEGKQTIYCVCIVFQQILWIEPRDSFMLGKCYTTGINLYPNF